MRIKEHIEHLRSRKETLKHIPTPEIVTLLQYLRCKQSRYQHVEDMKVEISKLNKWLALSQQGLDREHKAYEEREQMLKDQLLIHKAFMKNLAARYEETKKSYQEV